MAKKTGIWLIGARGSVATTTILGLTALRRGLAPTTGLVTELPALAEADLMGWDQLVVGGHEVRQGSLVEAAKAINFPGDLVEACREDMEQVDQQIVPGVLYRCGPAVDPLGANGYGRTFDQPQAAIDAIRSDIQAFQQAQDLHHVVVVLLASTEPETDDSLLPKRWEELAGLLNSSEKCPLRASSLYAIAALGGGCSFVNFTPSLGSSCEAIDQLARERGECHVGRDGKTGETLLKTVLAPMFASRHLEVLSWVGHNILGNEDGRVLASAEHKTSKLTTKDAALESLLGYDPQTHVSIEYVPSLGDRKTAWNHVHFRGFLNCEMTLQLTWQGHDSALAAPLVLDLVRLTEAAAARGASGALTDLAVFFKQPYGCALAGHMQQFEELVRRVGGQETVG